MFLVVDRQVVWGLLLSDVALLAVVGGSATGGVGLAVVGCGSVGGVGYAVVGCGSVGGVGFAVVGGSVVGGVGFAALQGGNGSGGWGGNAGEC